MKMQLKICLFTLAAISLFHAASSPAQSGPCGNPPLSYQYCFILNYYDDTGQDGFTQDNIMIADSEGNVGDNYYVSGAFFTREYVSSGPKTSIFSPGGTGGPVFVGTDSTVSASVSQRVFFNTYGFSEVYGQLSTAASTALWLNYYDDYDQGFAHDDIHITNPFANAVTATVKLGGNTHVLNVPAASGAYTNFAGIAGGPVSITATGPVLASSRTVYSLSFNEVNAVPVSLASTNIWFPWYDLYNSGYESDDIHISNPSTAPATVVVALSGVTRYSTTLPVGGDIHVSFPGIYGGGLNIQASEPVIASQRVTYQNSFNEVYGQPASKASESLVLNWYDNYDSGFTENIHIVNPSADTATVTLTLGSSTKTVNILNGGNTYVSFPGQVGGPVIIQSSLPVLVSARTVYQESFNEVNAIAQQFQR